MPSSLLRLAVALLTFGLGVTATTLWIAYRTPDFKRFEAAARHTHPFPPLPPLPTVEAPPLPPPPPPRAPIMGGILIGKAFIKPQPAYPPVALSAHAAGQVSVFVTVNESGNVVSAKAVSGHSLLQQAAVEAAYKWRFPPTLLSGQPVKVSGVIIFNFVLQ